MNAAETFGGYTVGGWFREDVAYRAMAIAYCTEKALREGYSTEKTMEPKKDRVANPIDAMRTRMFGPQP